LCGISRASIVNPLACSRPGEMAEKLQSQHLLGGAAVLLIWQQQGDLSVVVVPAAEERQTLDVIPVQVGEQDGPAKRLATQQGGDPADSRSGIEDESWRRIVMGDGDTGGMTAVADEVRTGCGRRPADTAKLQPHRLRVATLFSLVYSGQTSVDSRAIRYRNGMIGGSGLTMRFWVHRPEIARAVVPL
jgi:hypothetical protein